MDTREREMLAALRFDAAPTRATLWSGWLPHVNTVNADANDLVRHAITARAAGRADAPPAVVVHGPSGSGKSHLGWWARRFTAGMGGCFVDVSLEPHRETLWTRLLASILRGLYEPLDGLSATTPTVTQANLVVGRLAALAGLGERAGEVLSGRRRVDAAVARLHLDALAARLADTVPRDVVRALGLLSLRDDSANEAGLAYLHDTDEDRPARRRWGLRPVAPGDRETLVRDLARVLARSGPTLYIVDRIDELTSGSSAEPLTWLLSARGGLGGLVLASGSHRAWQRLRDRWPRDASDDLPLAVGLEPVGTAEVARELVAQYLAPQYNRAGFARPFDTWPVPREAFASLTGCSPRRLIARVGEHVESCLDNDAVPFAEFGEARDPVPDSPPSRRFADHRASIALDALRRPAAEPEIAELLAAAAVALSVETGREPGFRVRDASADAGGSIVHCEVSTPSGSVLMRGVSLVRARHVTARLDGVRRSARAHAGDRSRPVIVRVNPWPPSDRIRAAAVAFIAAGGHIVDLRDDDLRTLRAVQLTAEPLTDAVRDWLRARRPVSATDFGRLLVSLLPAEPDAPPRAGGVARTSPSVEPAASSAR